jgi:hypothetical protein
VPDYYEIVKEPIDLTMILDRINAGDYYITLEARLRRVSGAVVRADAGCVGRRSLLRTFGGCSTTAGTTTRLTRPTSSAPTGWSRSSSKRRARCRLGCEAAVLMWRCAQVASSITWAKRATI